MDETLSSMGTFSSPEKVRSKISDFKILSRLGEGSFSTVYKVERLTDNKIYAMKKVRMGRLSEREKSNALNEIRILASARCDHIIEYKDSFFDGSSDCLCIIMEFAGEGDLLEKLNKLKTLNKSKYDSSMKTPNQIMTGGDKQSNQSKERKSNLAEDSESSQIKQEWSIQEVESVHQLTNEKQNDRSNLSQYKSNKENAPHLSQNIIPVSNYFFDKPPSIHIEENQETNDQSTGWIYMPEEDIWNYFIQCLKGLQCLHSMGIVHRDLKCANVLISQNNIAKIGDLNVSIVTKRSSCLHKTHAGGTPFYTAPEIWQGHPCDQKSDIWSLGCVIYELCEQQTPFKGDCLAGLCGNILKGKYKQINQNRYSQSLSNVINMCLSYHPIDRPSCIQLLQMQELQQYLHTYQRQYQHLLRMPIHLEQDHFSPSRRLRKNLLEQQHLIDTINLPSNLKKLSPLLPKPHYEDSPPVPRITEFLLSDGERDQNINPFNYELSHHRLTEQQQKYHDLIYHSPIRLNLQKVQMVDRNPSKELENSNHSNTIKGGYHISNFKSSNAFSNNQFDIDNFNEQSLKKSVIVCPSPPNIKQSEDNNNNDSKDNEEKELTEDKNKDECEITHLQQESKPNENSQQDVNSQRLRMLSTYLQRLKNKPTPNSILINRSREFENVQGNNPLRFRKKRAFSGECSNIQELSQRNKDTNLSYEKFKGKLNNQSKDIKNNKDSNQISPTCTKQNQPNPTSQLFTLNNDQTFMTVTLNPNSNLSTQLQPQQAQQIKTEQTLNIQNQQTTITKIIQSYSKHNNYYSNPLKVSSILNSNVPSNNSNNSNNNNSSSNNNNNNNLSSFIEHPSNNNQQNITSLQKTLTTNDSVSELSPPIIIRQKRAVSHNQSINNNNISSQLQNGILQNSLNNPPLKNKSSSPQPRANQFNQIIKRYLPKQNFPSKIQQILQTHQPQQQITSLSTNQQQQKSPPLIQRRIIHSAQIVSSKVNSARSKQSSNSLHFAQKQTQSDVVKQSLASNKENAINISNYHLIRVSLPIRPKESNQYNQISQTNSGGNKIIKLAHVCSKHMNHQPNSNHHNHHVHNNNINFNIDKNIFYLDKNQAQVEKNPFYVQNSLRPLDKIPFYQERNVFTYPIGVPDKRQFSSQFQQQHPSLQIQSYLYPQIAEGLPIQNMFKNQNLQGYQADISYEKRQLRPILR